MMLLDASAVLGFLNDEPGKEIIETALMTGDACISLVNQAEVLSKLMDWGMSQDDAVQVLRKLALITEPFEAGTANETARLRTLTREYGLSLGDRACLATARLRQHTVLTGDRPWLKLVEPLGLEIISFRPSAH